jgi:phenylacetate-CoA ligase
MKKKLLSLPEQDFLSDKNWIKEFLDFDISLFEKNLRTKGESFWQKLGEEKALKIFHAAAEKVPAYKDFLKKRKIDHKKIKTIEDFKQVPVTDKKNYVSAYSLPDRCWFGKVSSNRTMAMSSGTSGEPTYWPRNDFQEYEANIIHELLYKYTFEIDKSGTLVVIGFPVGIYVSGMATTLPTWLNLAAKHKATFITPGNNKNEVLRAVKSLWGDFAKILLIGHPFFIKDVIETGKKDGVKWSTRDIRLMFCSEGFNEEWREHIMKVAGIKDKNHVISTYGSSEALLMAEETPLSIYIREKIDRDPMLRKKIVGSEVVPSVFQWNPALRYIESKDRELLFTSVGGTPLIRFNLHDSGSVIDFSEMSARANSLFDKFANKNNSFKRLPFVTLYGRSDHTIKFYAANIYPEHIRLALDYGPFLDRMTGKFVLIKRMDKDLEQSLEVNIEMKDGHDSDCDLLDEVVKRIYVKLKEINKEYLCICEQYKDKDLRPKVNFLKNGHEKYFKPGLKPKFIVKE